MSDAVPQEINSVEAKLVLGNNDKEAMILESEKQIMKVYSVVCSIPAGH